MMRVGILGCGYIAQKMALTLRMMQANGEDVCLYAAAARNLEKARDFCEKEGGQVAYGSYEEMVQDPNVDLVYVATPHSHPAHGIVPEQRQTRTVRKGVYRQRQTGPACDRVGP